MSRTRFLPLTAAVAAALLATTVLATGASAAPEDVAETTADAIAAVAPESAALLTPDAPSDGVLTASSSVADVGVPVEPDGIVTVDAPGAAEPVGIALPAELELASADVASDGTVVFEGESGVDAAVQAFADGSVRVQTVIDGPDAPGEYRFDLAVPDGSVLELLADGSVLVTSGGEFVAGVAAPWAADATGEAVPTHYYLDGTTVVQVVDLEGVTAFPVVADPWLGIALISKVVRVWTSSGYTYQVTPTAYGRVATELALWATWTESVSKGVPNRQNLQEQLICHPMSYVARIKSTWNLDTWRPTVGLAKTIAAKCNP